MEIISVERYELQPVIVDQLHLGSERLPLEQDLVCNKSSKIAEIATTLYKLHHLEWKEAAMILCLTNSFKLKGYHILHIGHSEGTFFCIPEMMTLLFRTNTIRFVTVHNHPSGSIKPSLNDDVIASKLVVASKLMHLQLMDNLIITSNSNHYYSYTDEGKLSDQYVTESQLLSNPKFSYKNDAF